MRIVRVLLGVGLGEDVTSLICLDCGDSVTPALVVALGDIDAMPVDEKARVNQHAFALIVLEVAR